MSDIRYLLDENVDHRLRIELLKGEPSIVVWKIGDPGTPPKGTSDLEIMNWCEKNSFILLTNNRKSMPRHITEHLKRGKHIPGIFELNPGMSISETVEELILILIYVKIYPLQIFIGFLFAMGQSQANEWIHKFSAILRTALDSLNVLAERDPHNLEEALEKEAAIDGTQ